MAMSYSFETECNTILKALSSGIEATRLHKYDTCMLDAAGHEHQLGQADRHIKILTESYDTILSNLRTKRNSHAPINRLMDELLIEIWSYIDIQDRFTICKVSSQWNRVALSAASLWTLINFSKYNDNQLEKLIHRSGLAPLHVVAHLKGLNYRPSWLEQLRRSGVELLEQRRHEPKFSQRDFESVLGRCATLNAVVGHEKSHYITPGSLTNPAPSLKELILKTDGFLNGYRSYNRLISEDLDPIPRPIFKAHTPRLHKISFHAIHAQWDDPVYNGLRHLHLNCPRKPASLQQIVAILDACPNLSHLHLVKCLGLGKDQRFNSEDEAAEKTTRMGHWQVHKTVGLLQLKYLHVEEQEELPIRALLSSLSLPMLENLYIKAPGFGCFANEHGQPLMSILPTIGRPLELFISLNGLGQLEIGAKNEMSKDLANDLPNPLADVVIPIYSTDWNTDDVQFDVYRRQWSWVYCADIKLRGFLPDLAFYHPGLARVISNLSFSDIDSSEATARDNNTVAKWIAVAVSRGEQVVIDGLLQPNDTPDSAGVIRDKPVNVTITDHCTVLVELFRQTACGGVRLDTIERLEIGNGFLLPDDVYHDFFSSCHALREIKVSFNTGVGILTAVIKDQLSPNLTVIHLDSMDQFHSRTVGRIPLGLLAVWVESRKKAAQSITNNIQFLKKIIVQNVSSWDAVCQEESKSRIEAALGDGGFLHWEN